jgi:hypothetical protein
MDNLSRMIDSLLHGKTVVSGGSIPIFGDNVPDDMVGSRPERRGGLEINER